MVNDLDAGEGVTFDDAKDAALQVRRSLEGSRAPALCLRIGAKGIHVVGPLIPKAEWREVRNFPK